MRLKKFLLESENDKKLGKLKKECRVFIQNNKKSILDQFFLKRATSSEYPPIKYKEYRERRFIRGMNDLFFFHDYFRPSEVPSREKQIPCTAGRISERFDMPTKNNYVVFPVGSNYKMVYADGIEDFNYNILTDDGAPENPIFDLEELCWDIGNPIEKRFSKTQAKKIKDKIEGVMDKIRSNKPSDIKEGYNILVTFLENENVSEKLPEVAGSIQEYKKYFDEYFGRINTVKKLNKNMKGLEVGLYAPDGFYYIQENYTHNNYKKFIE